MNLIFEQAGKNDINELIRLRLAYMNDDFGSVSEHEKSCMETQLKYYFARKLGTELIAFVARDTKNLMRIRQMSRSLAATNITKNLSRSPIF